MDTIRFNPDNAWSQSDFWLGRGKYAPQNRTWFLKYIGSMLSGGWHLCKFVRIYFIVIPISILAMQYYGINIYWIPLFNFIPYVFGGMVFELSYYLKGL